MNKTHFRAAARTIAAATLVAGAIAATPGAAEARWTRIADVTAQGAAAAGSGIGVVWLNRDAIEMYFVTPSRALAEIGWTRAGGWGRPRAITPPGSASSTGGVAVLAPDANSREVYAVAPDGALVEVDWIRDRGGWQPPTRITSSGTAATGGGVAALAPDADTREVYVVTPSRAIAEVAWIRSRQGWQAPTPITAPATVTTTSGLAVLAPNPDLREVYAVTADRALIEVGWLARRGWLAPTAITGPNTAGVGSGVAAVAREAGTREVFFIDPDRALAEVDWLASDGWKSPRAVTGGAIAASTSGHLAAISPVPNMIEIHWVKPQGVVAEIGWVD